MKLHKIFTSFILALFCLQAIASGKINLERIEPSVWWIGMKNPDVQLLVYGKQIAQTDARFNIPGVSLSSTIKVQNENYLFLNLHIIGDAKPGNYAIEFVQDNKIRATGKFTLCAREQASASRKGFDASDMIYLIMPDRFANGDPSNDNMPGMLEQADRSAPYGRHGGDLKGIMDHLDYIANIGATAIWLNPVLENNQLKSSYHGYSITDYYKVDPRFGTNEQYRELVHAGHLKGLKMIMDMVNNHCGSYHWWMNDLPTPDWINQFPEFNRSNYRISTVTDPHASKADMNGAVAGWFDNTMPDLNLRNELMRTYLIQNSIWWIEYAGLDGIRMDTYPYPDKEGMVKWASAIMSEYSDFNIVGECWIADNAKLAVWQKDFPNSDGFNSQLPSLMDFPLTFAIHKAFNEKQTWTDGIQRIYDVVADDYLYPDPFNLVIFAENHDAGRIFEYLEKDLRKLKMSMALLATMRGIPQLYYGTELLMAGDGTQGHANIRHDFPGGWPGDTVNSFIASGRTPEQNEAWNYMSALFIYRKNSPALQFGNLTHFVPMDNIYVYFRELNGQGVMVIFNNNDTEEKDLNTVRFAEILSKYTSGRDIITGNRYQDLNGIHIRPKSALVIELH
jgi:neopullulanase